MKKFISVVLTVFLVFGTAFAGNETESTARWIINTVSDPTVSYIGGEWTVIGLARGGFDERVFFEKYYQNAEQYISSCGGMLHEKKYTEYSRVVLAMTAIGKNPENIGGYNLLMPLADFEKTVWQGLNGAVWALIALDSGNYDIPINTEAKVLATREKYLNTILEAQNPDGGWAISSGDSDADMTAMALVALARYKDSKTKKAIDDGLIFLSAAQCEDGGFGNGTSESAESAAQVLTALSTLGIPYTDVRFVKDGKTVYSNLLSFFDGTAFKHLHSDFSPDLMATEQCFYALSALKRFEEGKTALFDMSDVSVKSDADDSFGLQGKDESVKKTKREEAKVFSDVSGHYAQKEIEELSARGIINGKGNGIFDPDGCMTRAEFSAITVNALGLSFGECDVFSDVNKDSWYYPYVSAAYSKKIVAGVAGNRFAPFDLITREQASAMIRRAANLCGLFGQYNEDSVRDALSAFSDYKSVSPWAEESLAFCFDKKIMPDDEEFIRPSEPATRAEIAVMVYNLLDKSNLLKD